MDRKGSVGFCLFDLDALDPDVALHINVLKAVVAGPVGEAHHGAIGEFDIELVIVEVDGHL